MEIADSVKKYVIDNSRRGYHGIELSPMSNTIRFTAKYEGCIHSYVVGDFNGWRKSEEYKLVWQLDTKDGILKMMKDVKFNGGLKNGIYHYKFILVDCEGNEKWIDSEEHEKNNLEFNWINVDKRLEIIASNKYVSVTSSVELVGIYIDAFDKITFPKLKWKLENQVDGIEVADGKLSVSDLIEEGTEVNVIAFNSEDETTASKKIIVSKSIPKIPLVHYFLDDNKYCDDNYIWNIWAFQEGSEAIELEFSNNTDFGVAAYVPYKNFIVRKKQWGNNWVNQWAEQSITFETTNFKNNIYILSGDSTPYYSLKEALIASRTKIKFAVMDDSRKIKVYLTKEPLLGIEFNLYINGEKIDGISTINRGTEVIITNLPQNICSNDLVVVSATNMYKPCKVTMRNYLDKYYYSKDDLGVTFNQNRIKLKLWAPTAYKVEVALYNDYAVLKESYDKAFEMEYDYKTGVHYITIDRLINENKYYLFKVYFRNIDKNGEEIEYYTYAVDPYANSVCINGDKGCLLDIYSINTMPMNWKEDESPIMINKNQSILYEMHIRDFTINDDSGVTELLRGTYLGATEENTFYIDKISGKKVNTALSHLVELGVTHIHLMPVFDFGSVDESIKNNDCNRNWGYDPKNFNVPEGSYCTNPYDPTCRIKEFREMVLKFHKHGIRVVMDMVYNHMMTTENMDNIVPGYYFRTDYLGRYTNGSGCGNEIATERPMVRKFIIDSCMHWIKDYHIDGMRFDLMELIDIKTTKEIVRKSMKIDENFLIYGEPWKGGESPIKNGTYKGSQKDENFSVFNDTFRDALRGNNDPSNGFINGDQHNSVKGWGIIEGLKGSIYTLTAKSNESINYLDAHDNYTIWDQIEKSQNLLIQNGGYRKNIPINPMDSSYVRQNLFGASILFTSQGIPFLQCGCEFLRTKQGDHNSYKSNDEVNSIKWKDKLKYFDVFNYYKGLIEIKKNIKLFRKIDTKDIKKNLNIYFANSDENCGVIISNITSEIKDEEAIIIYNGTSIDNYDVNSIINLPLEKSWSVIANYEKAGLQAIDVVTNGNIPLLKSFSTMILYSKQ